MREEMIEGSLKRERFKGLKERDFTDLKAGGIYVSM